MDSKQRAIKELATRLNRGENWSELVAAASEDEATKMRSGDLGFFSEWHMPAEFLFAVSKMHIGEISQPVRTRLGFHIIQLTDRGSARQMTFDEAQEEVGRALENEKRQRATQDLGAALPGRAEFARSPLVRPGNS